MNRYGRHSPKLASFWFLRWRRKLAESKYIHKSHNISVLLYHVVCVAKYRRVVFSAHVDEVVREACLEIAKRYEMIFLENGFSRFMAPSMIFSTVDDISSPLAVTVRSALAPLRRGVR